MIKVTKNECHLPVCVIVLSGLFPGVRSWPPGMHPEGETRLAEGDETTLEKREMVRDRMALSK